MNNKINLKVDKLFFNENVNTLFYPGKLEYFMPFIPVSVVDNIRLKFNTIIKEIDRLSKTEFKLTTMKIKLQVDKRKFYLNASLAIGESDIIIVATNLPIKASEMAIHILGNEFLLATIDINENIENRSLGSKLIETFAPGTNSKKISIHKDTNITNNDILSNFFLSSSMEYRQLYLLKHKLQFGVYYCN